MREKILLISIGAVYQFLPTAAALELFDLTLSELSQVEITSMSKRETTIASAAAAVFVITEEDIRRSGATQIPELLRAVPGLKVAQIDAYTWAVTARGYNSAIANKLLVLVDGRVVYSPSFSGTFWDEVDVVLEEPILRWTPTQTSMVTAQCTPRIYVH